MTLKGITIGLAPMEGVSEFAMRLFISLCSSPSTMGTPFLRVTQGYRPESVRKDFFAELFIESGAVPYKLVPQMMSPVADEFSRMAEWLLTSSDFVEINCGCPSPKVFGNGAGSALLMDPSWFVRFIEEISNRLNPECLAVKIRTGVESTEKYQEMIDGLAEQRLKYLCIHGRTKKQRYTGKANWDHIAYAANNCHKFHVVGSGDICDFRSFIERRSKGVDNFIVGRGALRNPWLFEELNGDGELTKISYSCMWESLCVYALLWETQWNHLDGLIALVRDGVFIEKAVNDEIKWRSVRKALSKKIGIPSDETPKLSRQGLGKVKLLWNYLRSSLSEDFFSPSFLRAKSFSDFSEIYWTTVRNQPQLSTDLRFQSKYDWVYAGESNPLKKEV